MSNSPEAQVDKFLNAQDQETNEINLAIILDPLFLDTQYPPNISLANLKRRRAIESRVSKIRIDDLFISGELRQKVQIIPDKFMVEFRTPSAKEALHAKHQLTVARNEVMPYVSSLMAVMEIAIHLHSYNGKQLAPITKNNEIDEKAFDERYTFVSNLPQQVIEDLWVNQMWFLDRIRQEVTADNLKAG